MAVRLHVVYAGRGDAMIIEDGAQLYLLDGAPRGRSYLESAGAPYYRYLMAALREVSAAMNRAPGSIEPDAVIVSHADEDHYGGIKQLFEGSLATAWTTVGTPARPLVFNGPLITQVLSDPRQPGQAEVAELLQTYHFGRMAAPPGGLVAGAFAFGPFAAFSRPAPPPIARTTWSVDESPNNLASVLMFHTATRMVFTGDSAGYLVAPFIGNLPGIAAQPLSIFKVPHHGSLRNSQRAAPLASVSTAMRYEYALLCLLVPRSQWDAVQMPADWRQLGPLLAARRVLYAVGNGVDLDALRGQLLGAFNDEIARFRAGAPGQYPAGGAEPASRQLWRELKARLETQGFLNRPRARGRRSALRGIDRYWIDAFLTPALQSDAYTAARGFGQIKAFYRGFVAKNHVISADGTYRHPSVATLAAIAAVALERGQTARVWVTDGHSVDVAQLTALVPGWAARLEIRHLSRGTRLVLDVTAAVNAANPALLDPTGTAGGPIAAAVPLNPQFARNPSASLPERTLLGTDRYTFQVVGAAAATYLAMDANGVLSLSTAAPPQSFTVGEAWSWGANDFRDVLLGTAANPPLLRPVRLMSGRGGWALWTGNGNPPWSIVTTDAAQHYTTTDPNSAAIAYFQLARVAAARALTLADPPATGPQPLAAFCVAAGITAPVTCAVLLQAMVGPDDARGLAAGIRPHVVQRVLGWNADPAASTVTWTRDAQGLLVTAAEIVATLGTPLTFALDDVQATIASAGMTLAAGAGDGTVALKVAVHTADGIDVDDDATVQRSRSQALDAWLGTTGLAAAEWPNVTLGEMLVALTGAEPLAMELMGRAPDFLNQAQLAASTLDHAASSVQTLDVGTGGVNVACARLFPLLAAPAAGTLGGKTLTLSAPVVTVTDALLPAMEVTVQAAASLDGISGIAASLTLTDPEGELDLRMPDGTGLAAVAAALGATGLAELAVPLANQALSSAGLALSSLGVTVVQPVAGTTAYEVSSVYGTIAFAGWSSLLPDGFPAPASSTVYVRVFDPLTPAFRRVGLDASFSLPVGAGTLDATFSAWPLDATPAPAYAYTLALASDFTAPCTLGAVLTAAGLGSALGTPGGALPAIAGILDRLALERLELDLTDPGPGGAASIDGASVRLVLSEPWSPLANLSLTAGLVDLRYEGGTWGGTVAGTMALGTGAQPTLVTASYDLPTPGAGGAFKLTALGDLTLDLAATLLGAGSLASVPIVGPLASSVSVNQVELLLGAQAAGAAPTVTAVSVGVTIDAQALGVLDLTGLAVDVDRTLASGATTLAIEAQWGDQRILNLSWDSAGARLSGSIRLLADETVGDLVAALLPAGAPVDALPLGAIKVRSASLVLDTADFSIASFAIDLDTSAVLHLGPATVTGLQVQYERGAGAAPTRYVVHGTLSGNGLDVRIDIDCAAGATAGVVNASIASAPPPSPGLTLKGLAGLLTLGTVTLPTMAGAPTLDVAITSVTAQVAVGTGTALTLRTLEARAATTGTLPLVGTLELLGVAAVVRYDATGAAPVTTGTFAGTLRVAGVDVALTYALDAAGQGEFTGSAAPATDPPPDFRALVSQGPFAAGAANQVPADQGLPAAIPMARLDVRARPRQLVEVSGFAASTEWTFGAGGLTGLSVQQLGGRVRVQAGTGTGGPAYDVSLFGTLQLGSSVSGTATFSFDGTGRRVITATVAAPQEVRLPDLASRLSGGAAAWDTRLPAGTAPIALGDAAYVYLDLAAGVVALYGSVAGLGTAALISRSDPSPGYVFIAGLDAGFRLQTLWSALAPVDQLLTIESANLSVLAYSATVDQLQRDIAAAARYAVEQGVTGFAAPFADLPALSGALPSAAVPAGTSVYAKLALSGSGGLSSRIGRIANAPASVPAIVVYAALDHDHPEKSAYQAEVHDLVLLGGGLTLDGALTYTPGGAESLAVDGTVGLKLTEDGSPYLFHGSLSVTDAQATFTASARGGPVSIPTPFGMFGITIATPTLTAVFTYPDSGPTQTAIDVSGSVTLAKLPALTGHVVFAGGKPVVASVSFTGTLSVVDLFADLLTGGTVAPSWPASYQPVAFKGGQFYGAPAEVTVGTTLYAAGYHLQSCVSVFDVDFGVRADMAADRSGITVSGSYGGKVDLVIVQLTGYTDPATHVVYGGPTFALATTGATVTRYEVGCGISVFSKPFLTTTFSYDPVKEKFAGTATPAQPIAGITTIGFTWSETEGLRIAEFPFLHELDVLLDWASAIEAASASSEGCSALVGLVFQETMTTGVTADVTQRKRAVTGEALALTITATFTIYGQLGASQRTELVAFDLPIDVTIPSLAEFDLDHVVEWLGTTLVDNAATIAGGLLAQPAKAAEFFGAIAVTKFGPDLIADLLCRDIKPPNVEARGEELSEEAEADATAAEGEAAGAATGAASAASMSAAAAAVVKATAAAGVLQGIVDGLKKLWHYITGSDAGDQLDQARAAQAQAQAALEAHMKMRAAPPLTVAFAAAAAAAADKVTVSWVDANLPADGGFDYEGFANFAFRVQVATDAGFADGTIVGDFTTQDQSARSATVASDALARVTHAWARLAAVYATPPSLMQNGVSAQGAWLDGPGVTHPVPLPAPVLVTVAWDAHADAVTGTVASVAGAAGYRVELIDHAHGDAVLATVALGPTTLAYGVAASVLVDTVAGASILARAYARGDGGLRLDSPAVTADSGTAVATIAPPAAPAIAVTTDGVHAAWPPLPAGTTPGLRLRDSHGTPLPTPLVVTPDPGGAGATLGGPALVDGARLGVQLRTVGAAGPALWSPPSGLVTVAVIAAPAGLAVTFTSPDHVIAVTWTADARATGFEIGVTDAAGAPLAPTITPAGAAGAAVSGAAIVAGSSYRLRARLTAAGAVATWSGWTAVATVDLAAPAGLGVTYAAPSVRAAWTAVPGATAYEVVLTGEPGGAVLASLSTATPAADVPLPAGAAPVPGTRYTVTVRAAAGVSTGPAATASLVIQDLLHLLMANFAAGTAVSGALAAATAASPASGAVELLVTLAAAGYAAPGAEAAVAAHFTAASLDTVVQQLRTPGPLAGTLLDAGVVLATALELAATLSPATAPILLVLDLRSRSTQAELAAALVRAYPVLTADGAAAVCAAAFVAPWALGGLLSRAGLGGGDAVASLRGAYPALHLVEGMASLVGGGYSLMDAPTATALRIRFNADGNAYTGAVLAMGDDTGAALAAALKAAGDPRAAAAGYVTTAYPALTPDALTAALDAAFG